METTIQVSKKLSNTLKDLKMHEKESYEDLIWDLIEDRMELSEQTKETLKEYEKDIKEGNTKKFVKFEDVKKES
jgi:hypothetical protein